MSTSPSTIGNKPVTRADIEAKLAEIRGVTDDDHRGRRGRGQDRPGRSRGILVVVVAFLLGRRRGHKKSTIVEIRRV